MLTVRRLFRVSSFASLAGLGCMFDSPSFRDCNVGCNDGAACPSGMECRLEPSGNAFCIAPDFPGSCESPPAPQPEDPARAPLADQVPEPSTLGPPVLPADGACRRSGALAIEPCTPPPPCAGTEYAFSLQVAGGGPDRVWGLASASSDEIHIDPSTGRLSGKLTEAVEFTVTVSDGSATGESRYRLEPRSSCWLAYPSEDEGGRRVSLIDPLLLEAVPRVLVPGELAAGASVEDFRFSPDGRWLAVRIDEGGTRRIELFGAPLWTRTQSLDITDTVVEYAWSPNGRVLAVVTDTSGGRALGGVRVSADPGEGAAAVMPLTPARAPVEAPLLWVGNSSVAFHAPDVELAVNHRVYTGVLSDDDLQFKGVAANPDVSFPIDGAGSVTLVPSSSVVVIVHEDGTGSNITSFAATPAGPALVGLFDPGEVLVSPSGDYLARSVDGELQLFRTGDSRPEPLPTAVASGCDRVLAWSSNDARVACSSAGDSRGNLRIFTLASGGLTGALVEGDYDYPLERNYRRRAFAPGNRWFTFTTDFGLQSIDLNSDGRFLQRDEGARIDSLNAATDLVFSPDGGSVLVHTGQWLALGELDAIEAAESVTDAALDDAIACTESDAWASDGACGTARTRSSQIIWSPDSRVFAFRTADSELRLHQTRGAAAPRLLSNSCDSRCIASSEFQPSNF